MVPILLKVRVISGNTKHQYGITTPSLNFKLFIKSYLRNLIADTRSRLGQVTGWLPIGCCVTLIDLYADRKIRGPNVWIIMSVNVVCLALAYKKGACGELTFDIAWCCRPHRMRHGQYPYLKIYMIMMIPFGSIQNGCLGFPALLH